MSVRRLSIALWVAIVLVAVVGCTPSAPPAAKTAAATPPAGSVPAPTPAAARTPAATPTAASTPAATLVGPVVPIATPTAAGTAAATTAPLATPTGVQSTATTMAPAGPYARIITSAGRPVMVKLEVADTPETRSVGLSRRPSLPEDAGMLFVFPSDGQAAFWMKDTLIPLSIAFISAEGRILEIQDMERLSEDLHRPARPYRYALEVNQGFFKKNGVNAGDRIEFQLGGRS